MVLYSTPFGCCLRSEEADVRTDGQPTFPGVAPAAAAAAAAAATARSVRPSPLRKMVPIPMFDKKGAGAVGRRQTHSLIMLEEVTPVICARKDRGKNKNLPWVRIRMEQQEIVPSHRGDLLQLPDLQTGLQILDPEEVEYIRSHAKATVGGSVTLDCGPTRPNIFIWGFTKPGSANNVAVAYNYGQGLKLQSQFSSIGHMQVADNSSALLIEGLQRDAEGMYTCQALYDTDEGARITFYFTRLDVEDD
ncbi:hypothetical protein EXN66_Car008938 [Channa argus]|uniref:Ig-like domain-containing protein n=1 Tax=Channa argus TaxID=215402 RepID=A0A6G1PSL6_CHAAH|nr:hypothetical protein EXN66_Car008938 [Channa argus]